MLKLIKNWTSHYFSDKEAHILFLVLVLGFALIFLLGHILAPVIASLIIAYLLDGLANWLHRKGCSRRMSLMLVYCAFIGLFLLAFLGLVPLLWQQLRKFAMDIPNMAVRISDIFNALPERFPSIFSANQMDDLTTSIATEFKNTAKLVFTASLSSIPSVLTLIVYLILVPLLVFFFLKDKGELLNGVSKFLPKERGVLKKVWAEMDEQLGNYIRGKAIEIVIVGIATWIAFFAMHLPYSVLLAVLNGISVIIPYVGAVLITFPVLFTAYFHFGLTSDFYVVMALYAVIQGIDSNLLVPLLFSEAVNLHPVLIILSVLFFGGIFGFWGAFFAIPLATLVKAVLSSWPRSI